VTYFIIGTRYIKEYRETKFLNFEECNPFLFSINFIAGISLFGGGRYEEETDSKSMYQFLYLWFIPLIPLNCYRAKEAGLGSFEIFGHEKWDLREVLYIILLRLSAVSTFISIIYFVAFLLT
jgi:hypothetical protein